MTTSPNLDRIVQGIRERREIDPGPGERTATDALRDLVRGSTVTLTHPTTEKD